MTCVPFTDYYWSHGLPKGLGICECPREQPCYMIIKDPYGKRVTVEHHREGVLHHIAYDSLFLDFRKLNSIEQLGWEKEIESESEKKISCLIRNQEGRAIFREKSYFQEGLCKVTLIFNLWDILLSTHEIWLDHQRDPFNGVVLFDTAGKPVMVKKYRIGGDGEFEELLSEEKELKGSKLQGRWTHLIS